MLFVGAGLRLRDGKGFSREESLQYTFKSNKSVTVKNVKWYTVPNSSSRMSATVRGRVMTHSLRNRAQRIEMLQRRGRLKLTLHAPHKC